MKDVAKLMAIRFGVYGVLVAYLACDLFVFQGPVYKSLNEPRKDEKTELAEAKAAGVVARVYYRPIFRAQVEETMKEYLWRRGRSIEDTSAGERRLLRWVIVNELIDDELVKLQIKVSTSEEVNVPGEQIDRALAAEMKRYPGEEVFEALADRAGWSGEKERRMRLAARIQRAEHLERMVDVAVSEEEAKAWFEKNQDSFPGGFEDHREAITDALLIEKRDRGWKKFRVEKLHRYAAGKVDLFEEVIFEEEE
ncbi:hypothetical protein N9062_01110 [Akkermansiaceae bacterium]|nr:hypothetical protein [bacterium]MDB4464938.1 hypothetical protein [Akkermansiaceae bacterium]MDB4509579.1 hypothetical protein [Akkermansiaceae bacterium]